jgi:hypothetical protein
VAATWKKPPSTYLGLSGGLAFCIDEAAAELLAMWRKEAETKAGAQSKEFTL